MTASQSAAQRLIVVGAGPKGLAIAAKAQVLRSVCADVPEVLLVDHQGIAENWTGRFGYTDGRQQLATSPMKDIGFPYNSTCWRDNNKVNVEMIQYSWHAFLTQRTGPKLSAFAEWVDRGFPSPSLKEWAKYLQWVFKSLDTQIDQRKVTRIHVRDRQWRIKVEDLRDSRNAEWLTGAGVVITGPGTPLRLQGYDDNSLRFANAENFWKRWPRMQTAIRRSSMQTEIAVIGDGGAAASVVTTLLSTSDRCRVTVITPSGVMLTRGESYDENRHYSNPRDWPQINSLGRERFLRHTTLSVVSRAVKKILDQQVNLSIICGQVDRLELKDADDKVWIHYKIDPPAGRTANYEEFDFVVVAIGFDAMWWAKNGILTREAARLIRGSVSPNRITAKALGQLIEKDLSIHIAANGVTLPLHLPMMSSTQGPGFPGLGCLGLLSDRILKPYCD
ncbi:SidA/IucD/PvdA family monooxygenase [Lentzea jiangxiensis]|uniref:L-lysine N6-monooxygenase MbtG n=1 Tax=Lentzea jiangxiensis TaxID=641025 RepID=A0A1H0X4G2_9PSEU|nr:SidA/IucD/PvdA family monooxygenase [Lentzea jiangxiensis]SDP97780.1 mycobactin lysine-N-oxygenase [Lentzea jiangxiensis]